MRFGLLGPVEVERDGRPVPIARGHERIVLAVLLLNANRLTPTSRLIGALWDEPPPSAKGHVHNLISRLRARLPADGADLIASRAGGYELRLDGHQLDLEEFRLLVDRGRAAMDAARPADAFAAYTAALQLWRGPALADVPDEFGVQSRLALQEEHLAAAEARLWAGLAVHRYDLLREVAALAAEHPHRERLHEIRMTALVALGRRAEALAVYRQVRQAFVDDLGVEPGPALRRLEQQILQGGEVVAAPVPVRPVPRQLPPAAAVVIGRAQLVADVSAALRGPRQGGSPVVLLTGPGGVGKSTVALTVAHSTGDLFPGGRLYADLRGTQAGPVDPHDVAGWWLHALGVAGAELPDDPDERIAALRSQAGDRRLLLVLDDAAGEEQVRPLLVGAPGSATVITSRRQLGGLVGVARWAVPMLAPENSRRLLAEIAGPDRVVREPAAAAAIAERCGHLPLALCVVAARLSVRPEWTLADIERRLAEQSGRLDVLAVGDLNVRASIGLSYHTLGSAARRLLRRLGLIDFPDWPAWLAGELTGAATATEVDRTVDELLDSHLVESLGRDPVGQARFRLHALVADFARERAGAEDGEPERSAALARSLRGWLALAAEADQRLGHTTSAGNPEPRPADGPAPAREAPAEWLEVERANLVEAVLLAGRTGHGELAGAIALRLVGFFSTRSYDDDLERVLDAAVLAARDADDPDQLLRLLTALFLLLAQRGRYAELPAIATEELALARRLRDLPGEVLALTHVGRAARMLDRFAEATGPLEQALALARRREVEPDLLSRALAALAGLLVDMGRARQALPLCEEVLRLDGPAGAGRRTAIHRMMVGIALVESDRLAEGGAALDQAYAAALALGDERGCAFVELALADLDLRAARWSAARRRLERSLSVLERIGDRDGVGEVLRSLGDLAIGAGDPARAIDPLRRSLAVWTELGARLQQARTLARLASAAAATGDAAAARGQREECQRILADLGLDQDCLRLPRFVTPP